MTEIMRQRSRVVAIVGELVSGRMSQHVWMNLERKLSGSTGTLNHSQEPSWRYWSSGFRRKHVGAVAL
jgi:hypothetical protein